MIFVTKQNFIICINKVYLFVLDELKLEFLTPRLLVKA